MVSQVRGDAWVVVPLALVGALLAAGAAMAQAQPRATTAPPKAAADAGVAVTTRSVAPPAGQAHWGYEGTDGPRAWGTLAPEWTACGKGRTQSPVDLGSARADVLPPLTTEVHEAELRIAHNEHTADVVNTGHALQVSLPGGDTLKLGDAQYELVQFHFHLPSEHTVKGKHYPLEAHFVHRSASGALAVVGVFFEEGAANEGLARVLAHVPSEKGVQYHYEHVKADGSKVLPTDRGTWRYDGSLTTPPCSEGVKWVIFKTPVKASPEQLAALRKVTSGNNRPPQALNGRTVVTEKLEKR